MLTFMMASVSSEGGCCFVGFRWLKRGRRCPSWWQPSCCFSDWGRSTCSFRSRDRIQPQNELGSLCIRIQCVCDHLQEMNAEQLCRLIGAFLFYLRG